MQDLNIHVMSVYNSLSRAEQIAADYFLQHNDEIYSTPIAKLSQKSGVSSGTWIRFCKSIGFSGLKELKSALYDKASEGNKSQATETLLVFQDIKDHENIHQIFQSIEASSIQAIQNTVQTLDYSSIELAANKIYSAKNIRLFGIGASGLVSSDFCQKLLRIGLSTTYIEDSHAQMTLATTTSSDDIAIIISNSGTTKEMLEVLELCHRNNASCIAITSVGKNPLSQKADIVLTTSSPELHHRSGAMSSRIAQLVVIDILFTAIANKNYDAIENYLEKSYEVSLANHKFQ